MPVPEAHSNLNLDPARPHSAAHPIYAVASVNDLPLKGPLSDWSQKCPSHDINAKIGHAHSPKTKTAIPSSFFISTSK